LGDKGQLSPPAICEGLLSGALIGSAALTVPTARTGPVPDVGTA